MVTFEFLLQLVEGLPLPPNDKERKVHWCDNDHILGISRQPGGGIEIFLRGEELQTSSQLIRRHMRFDEWTGVGAMTFRANRLVLPPNDYYIPAAAFLAEELLRRDILVSLQDGFLKTEPLIEMVLRRTALTEEEIIGLLGELKFLEALLITAVDSPGKSKAVDSWRGHEKSTRDFVFGELGVEVKTTRGDRSRHSVSNVMQVDPRRSSADIAQEELFLLSLGFRPGTHPSDPLTGFSLPDLVESILERLTDPTQKGEGKELQAVFLDKVSRYGNMQGRGYVHQEMKDWSAYQGRWQLSFLRIYDMADPAVKVLRRGDIQQCSHVVFDSVNFDIDLPDKVSGDLNPQTDLFLMAKKLLSA